MNDVRLQDCLLLSDHFLERAQVLVARQGGERRVVCDLRCRRLEHCCGVVGVAVQARELLCAAESFGTAAHRLGDSRGEKLRLHKVFPG